MSSFRRVFLAVVVVSLVTTALLAIGVLLAGDLGEIEGRILLTTLAIAGYSLLTLPGGVLLDRGELRRLAGAAVGSAAVAFALAMNVVWVEWDDPGEAAWKAAVVVTALAAALSQTAAVLARRRAADGRALVRLVAASLVAGFVTGALVAAAALFEISSDGYYRALAAVAVANVTLVVLQPILRRMAAGDDGVVRLTVDLPAASADGAIEELQRRGARVARR